MLLIGQAVGAEGRTVIVPSLLFPCITLYNKRHFLPAPQHCAETCPQAHVEGEGRRRVHQETPRLREQHGHGERTAGGTWQDCEMGSRVPIQ